MKTVFMGSPAFAVPCLRALHEETQVAAVVCQPDKPAGRGLAARAPEVKRCAEELGLPVLQPESLRPARSRFLEQLREIGPELVVVVAYGKILPQEVLDVPRLGCWNVHASLLPRYRGAAPIQWALIRGEARTGVTLMQMDAGMDTGPAILERALDIGEDDTSGTLHERLSALGAALLRDGLRALAAGALPPPRRQDEALATRAPLLDKEHGRADFTRPARLVLGQIRGVDPWPGAYVMVTPQGGEAGAAGQGPDGAPAALPLKLFRPRLSSGSGRPGEVLGADRDGLHVACGEGAVAIAELQLPGRKRMPAAALLSGFPLPRGTLLGATPNPLLDAG